MDHIPRTLYQGEIFWVDNLMQNISKASKHPKQLYHKALVIQEKKKGLFFFFFCGNLHMNKFWDPSKGGPESWTVWQTSPLCARNSSPSPAVYDASFQNDHCISDKLGPKINLTTPNFELFKSWLITLIQLIFFLKKY